MASTRFTTRVDLYADEDGHDAWIITHWCESCAVILFDEHDLVGHVAYHHRLENFSHRAGLPEATE